VNAAADQAKNLVTPARRAGERPSTGVVTDKGVLSRTALRSTPRLFFIPFVGKQLFLETADLGLSICCFIRDLRTVLLYPGIKAWVVISNVLQRWQQNNRDQQPV
jgi:hypothetical protein